MPFSDEWYDLAIETDSGNLTISPAAQEKMDRGLRHAAKDDCPFSVSSKSKSATKRPAFAWRLDCGWPGEHSHCRRGQHIARGLGCGRSPVDRQGASI